MSEEPSALEQLVNSYISTCREYVDIQSKGTRLSIHDPRRRMKAALRKLKRRKRTEEGQGGHRAAAISLSHKLLDFTEVLKVVNTEPDGSNLLVNLVTDSRASAVNEIRDELGWSVCMLLAMRGHHVSLKFLHSMECSMNEPSTTENVTPMSIASRNGDLATVQLLFSLRGDPCRADCRGWTSLHWASISGKLHIVEYLVSIMRVSVDARDAKGETALHWAAKNGYWDIVQVLTQKGGARLDILDASGCTPVMSSQNQSHLSEWMRGAESLTRIILESARIGDKTRLAEAVANGGLPESILDEQGWSALTWAAATGDTGVVTMLIGMGANPRRVIDTDGTTLVDMNVSTQMMKVVRANERVITAARIAISDSIAVTELTEAVADGGCIDTIEAATGMTCLHYAVLRCLPVLAQTIIKLGADVNGRDTHTGRTNVHYACMGGNTECLALLIKAKADLGIQSFANESIFHTAIVSGSAGCVGLLIASLEAGVVNAPVHESPTVTVSPLVLAASLGHSDVVGLLLNSKADIRVGSTNALLAACASGHVDTTTVLLNHTTSAKLVKTADTYGVNCLMKVAGLHHSLNPDLASSFPSFLEKCIEGGINLDAVDGRGYTALMHAARTGKLEACECLVKQGCSWTVRGKDGLSPSQVATKAGFFDLGQKLSAGFTTRVAERPSSRESTYSVATVGMGGAVVGQGIGLNRNQNVTHLVQQASTPFGLRFENLPIPTSAKEFAEWLISHGSRPCQVRTTADAITGKPLGYAFARFADRTNFQMASKLIGQVIGDRRLRIFVDDGLLAGTACGGDVDWFDTESKPKGRKKNTHFPM